MANTKKQSSGTNVPQYTSILGQPHMLAYINPEEERLLRSRGGMGIKGPGGILSYPPESVIDADYDAIGVNNDGTSYSGDDDKVSGGFSAAEATANDDDVKSGSGTIENSTVTYTGTPGEGDFKAYDTTFIDPYEYNDLINAGYSDAAAFYSSYYSENETYDAGYEGEAVHSPETDKQRTFYDTNTQTTISMEDYEKAKNVAKALAIVAGPIGLGYRAIIELQRKGILPGDTATSWMEDKGIPETSGSEAETKIVQMIEEGATDAEIKEELEYIMMDEEMSAKISALDKMSDAAFGESSSSDVAKNPENYFSDTYTQDNVSTSINEDAAGTSIDSTKFQQGENPNVNVETITDVDTVDNVQTGTVSTYDANTVSDTIANNPLYSADAQQGTVTDNELVDAEEFTIDVDAAAAGEGAIGEAIHDYASQNISKLIETSTVAGKRLAQELGEGNYTDSKATILGQMDIISKQFVDSSGNPKIPPWAQGMAREVSRTIAFKGMTGTAATAAMATAIMEASLGVAEKEATFFQTVTLDNLDNRQEAIINKANILSKFEVANLDARMTAAVSNAKAFLEMNLANLDNRQQTELINTQARIDGLLEDSKAINAARLFAADAENDFTKFYDNLNMQIDMHRADTLNAMREFNVGEINDNREFQASLDFNREKFYKDLQYNIELENARWRQSVTLKEAEMEFDAAKADAENMFALMTEALSQTWDREDAYFDYIWKTSESELERMVDLYEIDKEYEVEMRKANDEASYKTGQADWELFKWGWELADDIDWDFWA